jgi:YVTN family beta-propeller protein
VGNSPAGIAITPNNLFAYVANNNNTGIPGGYTVSVLNLTNNTVEQTISDSSFNAPYTVTINAAGTKAYVTNSSDVTVTIIDLTTNTITGKISGFDGPSGLVITPDGTRAYVNNYGGPIAGSGNGTTVSIVDLNTNVIVGTATVGLAPAALAITPDGAYVYVVNYVDGNPGTGTISIIRTSDNSVQLNAITGFSGPFAIAITPNGKYAYVTNFGSNNFSPVGTTVSVVDISTNTIAATIPVGIQPAGIAITPAGFYAYVSNYDTLYNGPNFTDLTANQGTVNIIDIHTNKVISPVIKVGLSPADIAISPNGQFAYVSNYTSNTVSVIALPFGLYDLNRLTPIYYQQLDETITKLKQAGLL